MVNTSTVVVAPTRPDRRDLKVTLGVMAAGLALSAVLAFGPLAGDAPVAAVGAELAPTADYGVRHLTPAVAAPATEVGINHDYGLRHLAPSGDWSTADYALRHLGE